MGKKNSKATSKKHQSYLSYIFIIMILKEICWVLLATIAHTVQIDLGFAQLSEERVILYQYLHGIDDGFYVNIGAQNPIYHSKTMRLKSQGWRGINISPEAQIISQFSGVIPEDINLNFALQGEIDSSELSHRQSQNKTKPPYLTLEELCSKFYYRKPNLMAIGGKEAQLATLKLNNWEEPLCKPDVILFRHWAQKDKDQEVNEDDIIMYLRSFDYVPYSHLGRQVLFLERKNADKYIKNSHKNSDVIKKNQVLLQSFEQVTFRLKKYFPDAQDIGEPSYDIFRSAVYFHFAVKGTNIDLDEIQRYSDKIAATGNLKGRKIVIYNFDPSNGSIIISRPYIIEEKSVAQNHDYFSIKFDKNGLTYEVYIYDHENENEEGLKIFTTGFKNKQPVSEGRQFRGQIGEEETTPPQINNKTEGIQKEEPINKTATTENKEILKDEPNDKSEEKEIKQKQIQQNTKLDTEQIVENRKNQSEFTQSNGNQGDQKKKEVQQEDKGTQKISSPAEQKKLPKFQQQNSDKKAGLEITIQITPAEIVFIIVMIMVCLLLVGYSLGRMNTKNKAKKKRQWSNLQDHDEVKSLNMLD